MAECKLCPVIPEIPFCPAAHLLPELLRLHILRALTNPRPLPRLQIEIDYPPPPMAIREGRWDCPSCASAGQLGRHVYCTGCGAPRPKEIQFYLPEDEGAVTDAGQLAQANAGADWICEHCGGSARATDAECPGCGAPRGSSTQREVTEYDEE